MEDRGPFDQVLQREPPGQRDRTAAIIVVLGILMGVVLLILVLPPVSIFDGAGDGGSLDGPVVGALTDEPPAPPAGFESLSPLYELTSEDPVGPNLHPRLTVNLSSAVAEDELVVLFTYDSGNWRRLGEATPVASGTAVQADVTVLPANVAAFRPVAQTRLVVGSLPSGSGIEPAAAGTLSTVNVGGLRPGADGSVVGTAPPSDLGVAVVPKIAATTPADVETFNAILGSEELRSAHVQAVLQFVSSGGYSGIDLDYQTFEATHGEAFTAFVESLSSALRNDGRRLTLTLPLPVQDAGEWDTLGFDWEALTPLVASIKLAPGPLPDTYFQSMEDALTFLTSRVPSSKLLLTLDPSSHERSVDGVQALTLTAALALASTPTTRPEGGIAPGETLVALGTNLAGETGASGLVWDEGARAVTFSYTGPGGARVVWLTNVFSEAFKIDLARRYQLGGIAVGDASQAAAEAGMWPLLAEYAETGAVTLVKPNGPLLTPRWTAKGGTLESTTGPSVTWRAPAEAGTYTLTLVVSDGVLQVGQELNVPVAPQQATVQ